MSTGKRILVHGLLAAVPLAVIGFLLAQLAGLYLDSRAPTRAGPFVGDVPARPAAVTEVTDTLSWRMPLTLAAVGFGFVAVTEAVFSLWRKPAPPPKPTPDQMAEELLQSLLKEAEQTGPAVHKVD